VHHKQGQRLKERDSLRTFAPIVLGSKREAAENLERSDKTVSPTNLLQHPIPGQSSARKRNSIFSVKVNMQIQTKTTTRINQRPNEGPNPRTALEKKTGG
jgi:hypothetical protein